MPKTAGPLFVALIGKISAPQGTLWTEEGLRQAAGISPLLQNADAAAPVYPAISAESSILTVWAARLEYPLAIRRKKCVWAAEPLAWQPVLSTENRFAPAENPKPADGSSLSHARKNMFFRLSFWTHFPILKRHPFHHFRFLWMAHYFFPKSSSGFIGRAWFRRAVLSEKKTKRRILASAMRLFPLLVFLRPVSVSFPRSGFLQLNTTCASPSRIFSKASCVAFA